MDEWTVVRFVHLLGIVFFLGGQLAVAAAVAPVLRGQEVEMRSVAKRFGIGSVVALVLIIASGAGLAAHFDRWGDGMLQLKLGLLVLVFVMLGMHVLTPYTRILSLAVLLTTLVIAWFGVNLAH
jgi:hypothetical protein